VAGVAVLSLCTLGLVLWNRRKLQQENSLMAEAAQKEEA